MGSNLEKLLKAKDGTIWVSVRYYWKKNPWNTSSLNLWEQNDIEKPQFSMLKASREATHYFENQ